jgi:hypothetical protein
MAPKFAQIHKQQNQEKEREGGGGGRKYKTMKFGIRQSRKKDDL